MEEPEVGLAFESLRTFLIASIANVLRVASEMMEGAGGGFLNVMLASTVRVSE